MTQSLNVPQRGDLRHRLSFYDAAGAPELVELATPTVYLTHKLTGATVILELGSGLARPAGVPNAIDIEVDRLAKAEWAVGGWLADVVLAWPDGLEDAAVTITLQIAAHGSGGVAGTNILRQADGTRIIRSSDGLGSLGLAYVSLTSRISDAESATAAGDGSLATRLSAEETARGAADNSLNTRLLTEEVTRAAGDTLLETRLSTEEVTRNSADTSLTSRVSTEEAARAADTGGKVSKAGDIMAGVLALIAGTAPQPGLALAGDPNTGMWSPAADTLAWSTAGTERLRIDSSGNVGLGTTAITCRLDVTGGFQTIASRFLRHADYGEVVRLGRNGTAGHVGIGYPDENTLSFLTAGTERLRVSSSGHVLAGADGAYDLGLIASSRFRDAFFSRNLTVGTAITAGNSLRINGTNAGFLSLGTADDVQVYRGQAGVLDIRSGATENGVRVYGGYTDASNYMLGVFQFVSGTLRIGTFNAGTFGAADLSIDTAGVQRIKVSTTGHVLSATDGAVDLGIVGNRFRHLNLSGDITAGGAMALTGALTTTAGASIQGLTVGRGNNAVSSNTALGVTALAAVGAGVAGNTALGNQALASLISGSGNNTAVGNGAALRVTSAGDVTAVGSGALIQATTASSSVAVGAYALGQTTTGAANVAVGTSALILNTTGSTMVAVGHQALRAATAEVATFGAITGGAGYVDGTYLNVQLTYVSGSTMVTYPRADIVVSGGAVTSVTLTSGGVGARDTTTVLSAAAASLGGAGAGFQIQPATFAVASGNTAVGYQASWSTTTAQNGVALGNQALYSATTGARNVALGFTALFSTTTAHNNVGVGFRALYFTTTGGDNVGVGRDALYNNLTGSGNLALGFNADIARTAGSFNIAIGHNVSCDSSTGSSQINIGNRYYHDRIALNGDAFIWRHAANIVAQRNGANAQSYYIHNFYTDASNYEFGYLSWQSNEFRIGTFFAGTGVARDIVIFAGGAARWRFVTSGHQTPANANLYDLGSVSLPVRTGHFGTSVITPYVRTTPTTVAALPAAATAGAGAKAHVTDATSTTFASPVAGGGANSVPVYSDGTQWLIG